MFYRNHFIFNKSIISILAIILCFASCRKKNDYDILKEKTDTTKVHLYIGLKALIGQTHTDPDLKKAKDELIKLLNSSSQKSELSAKDMYLLAKHLLKIKKIGKEMLQSDADTELNPVLPYLLKSKVNFVPEYNASLEHGILFSMYTIAKFHPKAPVPIANEIILYEAYRNRPETHKIKGIEAPFHALKSYLYAGNELCDLAGQEKDKVYTSPFNKLQFTALLTLFSRGRKMETEQLTLLLKLSEAISEGSIAICYQNRGQHEKANEHLEKSLDIIEGMGIITDETRLVRSYLDCSKGKESAHKGLKTIKLVLTSTTADKDTREDARYIQEYCEAAAVSDSKIKKKISYYNLVLKMMIHAINRTNVSGDFVNSREFKLLKKISSIVDTLAKIQSPDELKKFVKPKDKKLFEKSKGFIKSLVTDENE